jgi:hypothetical protein
MGLFWRVLDDGPSKPGVAGSSPAGRALSLASVVQSCAPQSIGTAMSAFANGGLLVAAAVAGGIALVTGFRIGSLVTPISALQVATGLAVTASPFATWSEPASGPNGEFLASMSNGKS